MPLFPITTSRGPASIAAATCVVWGENIAGTVESIVLQEKTLHSPVISDSFLNNFPLFVYAAVR